MQISMVALCLLLLTACCTQIQCVPGNFSPTSCCFNYAKKRMPIGLFNDYYNTSSSCSSPGVIFRTIKGHEICAKRSDKWVIDYMTRLDQNNLNLRKNYAFRNKIIFMRDNAPSHAAKNTSASKAAMGIKGEKVMVWPPSSPHLNPIENLWSFLKQKIYEETDRMQISMVALCLLLLTACCTQVQCGPGRNFSPTSCCFHYAKKRMSVGLFKDYYITSSFCSNPGVIFRTNNGNKICAKPSDKWVTDYMTILDQNAFSL
ncbi:uncharacterized protein LOC101730633 [Xenopus tropicalis]|uniref:Uncharacterized protein LOC101730633 n=2 Tax=Xenopus tropicalis TaxID=8364 RepID=A0A8J0T226_XENTR|nr:uncharacterized protein LOC101730633 [Xenopus tropicalis]